MEGLGPQAVDKNVGISQFTEQLGLGQSDRPGTIRGVVEVAGDTAPDHHGVVTRLDRATGVEQGAGQEVGLQVWPKTHGRTKGDCVTDLVTGVRVTKAAKVDDEDRRLSGYPAVLYRVGAGTELSSKKLLLAPPVQGLGLQVARQAVVQRGERLVGERVDDRQG